MRNHDFPALWRRALLLIALASLAACASMNPAMQRADELTAREEWEAAIAAYRQALRVEPANVELRLALTRTTRLAIDTLLSQAAAAQPPSTARDLYARVLFLDPNNERALAALRALENADRLNTLFREASRAQAAGRDKEARSKLSQLLTEAPDHVRGKELLRQLDSSAAPSPFRTLDASLTRPVTLEFRDAPVRNVFDLLSKAGEINFVFDRDLRQDTRISIFVRNVTLAEALDQISAANGLARRVLNNNTILIYPAQPQKLREYQDLVVRNFFLDNADARQISAMLRAVLRVRDLFVDEKRNLMVLRDTPEVVAMAVKLVAAHDQPEPEVMLEVEILEVKHSTLDDLGIRFPDQVVFGVASPSSLNAVRAANGASIQVSGLDKALILNLKHQLGSTNLLANPRIRVRNKEKAKVHIGDRVPVITSTVSTVAAVTTEQVSYLDVGIKLEVEPAIQGDDVVIKVALEVSSVTNTIKTNSGSTVFQLGTRNASTTLTLRDGETQILAGLLQKSERGNSSRLPLLGDLPVLGRLFSSESLDGDKTEVLLSITPRIARNIERPQDDLLEFNAGPDGGRPASAGGGQGLPPAAPSLPAGAQPVRAPGSQATPSGPGAAAQPGQPAPFVNNPPGMTELR